MFGKRFIQWKKNIIICIYNKYLYFLNHFSKSYRLLKKKTYLFLMFFFSFKSLLFALLCIKKSFQMILHKVAFPDIIYVNKLNYNLEIVLIIYWFIYRLRLVIYRLCNSIRCVFSNNAARFCPSPFLTQCPYTRKAHPSITYRCQW